MKLTYFQLESHLVKNLDGIYVISGEELFLKQEAIQLIRKASKQAGFNERIRIAPEDNNEDALYTALNSSSLLAEKRLIEINFRDSLPNKTTSQILERYATSPSPDTILLIELGKLDTKITKNNWYAALEKKGIIITIWPISREALLQWIIQRAKKYKLSFEPEAVNLLADYTEGNLIAAAQAIEKIYLLKPEIIDTHLIKTILTDESHFTVFDFIEQVIIGDKKRLLRMLESLKKEGIEPAIIVWGLTREMRLLSDLAEGLKQGLTYDSLFQKHRIFSQRQRAIRQFLARFTAENCWHFLTDAAHIDATIKGASSQNVWEQLQLFCLRLV